MWKKIGGALASAAKGLVKVSAWASDHPDTIQKLAEIGQIIQVIVAAKK